MAQAWTQDQRSDFVLQNPSNGHEDVELARWELAELLKQSDGRSEIVYTPAHLVNSYNGYGGNNMGDAVGTHNHQGHQDTSMNGSMNAHMSQNHPMNGHGQQNPYDVYSNGNGIPGRGYTTDGLGMQPQQSMYSSPSLNGAVVDPSSFHHNSTQSFTLPQDYSFSSIPRNTHPSMPDLRRIAGMNAQNGYRGPDYQDGLRGMNGVDSPSLNPHAQPQQPFPDFSRYQQQNIYPPPPSRHSSSSSQFSPSHSDMMQDLQPHPAFHNRAIARYDNMSNFPGTNSINGSSMDYSQADLRASSVDTASESQGASSLADPNDFQSFIRCVGSPSDRGRIEYLIFPFRRYLDQYARTPNRLAFGERSIIVMSSKVAQKSYGNEKRLVCFISQLNYYLDFS